MFTCGYSLSYRVSVKRMVMLKFLHKPIDEVIVALLREDPCWWAMWRIPIPACCPILLVAWLLLHLHPHSNLRLTNEHTPN